MSNEIVKTNNVKLKWEGFKLKAKKNAPEICVYSGVGMMASGTVAAVVATSKTQVILNELDEQKATIIQVHTDEQAQALEIQKVSRKAGIKIALAYTPSALLTIGGACSILKGFGILKGRYAGTCAALAIAQQQIEEYRSKVADEYGVDKERELLEKSMSKEESDTVAQQSGISGSIYQRMFDEKSYEYREDDANFNYCFVKSVQSHYNEVLQTRGHVFLNEVYDALGLDATPEGQVLGWIKEGKGDGYIDFGIDIPKEATKEFVEGRTGKVLLDFNVDGVVYNLI